MGGCSGLVFVCYGDTVAILNAFNGTVISSITTQPVQALLGSSPVINNAGDALFIQSKNDGECTAVC